MTNFNPHGFVVRQPDGRLTDDSMLCAASRRLAISGSLLEPVPGVPGLLLRLRVRQATTLTSRERQALYNTARTWHAARYGAPEPDPVPEADDPEPDPDREPEPDREPGPAPAALDDMTLAELQDLARAYDIPGRSKMDKEALAEAVRQADEAAAKSQNAVAPDAPPVVVPSDDYDTAPDSTLQELARYYDIKGRSRMGRDALIAAIRQAEASEGEDEA